MKYRTFGSIAVLLVLAGISAAGQNPSKQRLDAIWEAADDRVSRQVDVWFEDGDYPKVIHLLTFEATYAPHDYNVVTNLGWMRENVEDWDGALATYIQYRKDNPQDKDAALPEAQYYYMRKNYAPIPAILEPALKNHPHPNIYRILAHAYERQQKISDAIRVWHEYLAIAPNDAPAKQNLARDVKKLDPSKS